MSKEKSSEIHIGDLSLKLIQNFIFDDHVQNLCEKANRKLRTLARPTLYLILF